ncbi:MAG TPA: hypothetical protein VG960_07140 [Caulobacteraceae bacterium]|nr:hypothetical protein [Caulobacteraceae bacterium]
MPLDLDAILQSSATVADKIRTLHRAGYARADIARLLGKRYQHIRNVLEDDARSKRDRAPPNSSFAEEPSAFVGPPPIIDGRTERVQLDADGRLLLTPTLIEALDARPGEWVIATVSEDGEVALLSARAAMKQAQAIIRRFVPAGVSLVEELLAERRAEAERETRGE